MKNWFSLNLRISLLCLLLSHVASEGVAATSSTHELLKQGDVFDLRLHPREALECYLPAEKLDPENVSLLLRIARQYRHQMADAAVLTEKIRLSAMGLSYAQRAVMLAPKDSDAHLSVSISYAKSLELYGNKDKMKALREVKCCADQAIALNPTNDVAWYILGRWHERVADLGVLKRKVAELAYGSLPPATNDDAVRCFTRAIRLNPERSVYYVDLGIICAAMANKADAKKFIEKGLALPNQGKDDPDTKNRGREILRSLQ